MKKTQEALEEFRRAEIELKDENSSLASTIARLKRDLSVTMAKDAAENTTHSFQSDLEAGKKLVSFKEENRVLKKCVEKFEQEVMNLKTQNDALKLKLEDSFDS